jgi:hypothetical protein
MAEFVELSRCYKTTSRQCLMGSTSDLQYYAYGYVKPSIQNHKSQAGSKFSFSISRRHMRSRWSSTCSERGGVVIGLRRRQGQQRRTSGWIALENRRAREPEPLFGLLCYSKRRFTFDLGLSRLFPREIVLPSFLGPPYRRTLPSPWSQ